MINTNVPGHGLGITPAWAGKRYTLTALQKGCKDHPRVGGEKDQGQNPPFTPLGSPPRGRGKVTYDGEYDVDTEDHPRVGGEKTKKIP